MAGSRWLSLLLEFSLDDAVAGSDPFIEDRIAMLRRRSRDLDAERGVVDAEIRSLEASAREVSRRVPPCRADGSGEPDGG